MLERSHGANGALRELEHQRRARWRDWRRGTRAIAGNSASVSVDAGEIAEQADIAVLEQSRRTTCTQRNTERPSSFGISEPASRTGGNRRPRRPRRSRLQPRHRLVVADLALRQRHDRLQIEIDAVGLDGGAQERDDGFPVEAGERCDRVPGRDRRRSGVGQDDRSRRRRLQRIDGRQRRAGARQRRIVGGDRFGELLDQARKFLDLRGQRLRRRQRLVEDGSDLRLHDVEPPPEFRELTRQVVAAAREVGDLVAHFGAVLLAAGNAAVERKRRERSEPRQARLRQHRDRSENRAQRRANRRSAPCRRR